MMKTRYFVAVAAVILFCGCGLLKKYENKAEAPVGLYGYDEVLSEAVDTVSIADISWREFFTDPLLRNLIDSALVRNTDLKNATLVMNEADELLKASKLNFLPSLSFNPSISYNGNAGYTLPFSLEWSTPGFGSLTNSKREAMALALQAADNEQAVRSRLVADIAAAYFRLQMLDRQLEIMKATEIVWADVLETQRALMENGKAYSTSVHQMEASLMGIKIQKLDAEQAVVDAEYAICLMLADTPHSIERSAWDAGAIVQRINSGFPAQILDRRPDVRAAGRQVEAAYYVDKKALAAMFPSITLSGLLGWTNGGVKIADPIQLVYNAVASLAQPIFARGQLMAQYKVTQMKQEEAANLYAQTVLQAGNDVNSALRSCQNCLAKYELHATQVSKLRQTQAGTIELLKNGKATYLEVLMAQDALLKAEINEVYNMFDGRQSLIDLYWSLGGGAQ